MQTMRLRDFWKEIGVAIVATVSLTTYCLSPWVALAVA